MKNNLQVRQKNVLLGDEVCINAKEKKRIPISVLTEEKKKPRIK